MLNVDIKFLRDVIALRNFFALPEELLEKNLIEDLGFDSIQLVDLIFSLEEKYGLQITDMGSFLESLKSVRELIAYIAERNGQ